MLPRSLANVLLRRQEVEITGLRTKVVRLPLPKPILSATIEIHSTDAVLVFLDTDEGVTGEGLCFAVNGNRLKLLRDMVRSFEPLLIGLDPTMASLFHKRAWADVAFFGHDGLTIAGLAGAETALWDLRGRIAGLNVSRLLGAATTAVPVYASGGLWLSSSVDGLQREASDYLARGFKAIKMRVDNRPVAWNVDRVRAVREAIGPNIKLMADANQSLTVSEAIRLGRALEEYDLTWFEEPIPYWDHAGEAEISAALDTPIASGETEYTSRGMFVMMAMKSADVLMPDLQRMGGPTEFVRTCHIAAAFDVKLSSHLFSEMSLSLLAAAPTAYILEHMPWFEPIYAERIELDGDGNAIVPDRPGWGFSFDLDAVRRHAG
jgi:L-alanine-DL-glutamate epimerase-like enolase superfamily enzyme